MAEVDDPGKLLFSVDVGERTKEEYKKIGRSIQWRNSTKILFYSIAALIIIAAFSVIISPFIAILALAVVIEMLVFFEYSARNIANKVAEKIPLHYDFYEDGLTESIKDSESHLTWYNEIKRVKKNEIFYTFICQRQVYIIPRDLLDENSARLVDKIDQQIAARNKDHSLKHMKKRI